MLSQRRMMRSLFAFLLCLISLLEAECINDRPIIGIMTQPLGTENSTSAGHSTYIAASYVKFVESGGARVVPVHYDASSADLAKVFGQINGLVMPGGGADLSNTTLFRKSGQILYDLAIRANDNADVFPIWGTCMGFQFIALLTAQHDDILCKGCYDSDGTPMPLEFVEPAASRSNLFGVLSPSLKHKLATKNLTENSHHDGISPATFSSNRRLSQFYNVLSTNVDYANRPFASTIEAKKYPFAASQWHPEKNNFEWGTKLGPAAIPHGADATAVSQYMANFVVSGARQSMHHYDTTKEEAAASIYNFPAVPDPNGYFDQIYKWDRPAIE